MSKAGLVGEAIVIGASGGDWIANAPSNSVGLLSFSSSLYCRNIGQVLKAIKNFKEKI